MTYVGIHEVLIGTEQGILPSLRLAQGPAN
jgi:hypothetical protein